MDTNWPRCNQTFRNRPTRVAKGGTNLWIDQGRITPCPKNCSPSSRVETGTNLGRAFPLQERDTPEAARVRSKGGTNINQSKRKT